MPGQAQKHSAPVRIPVAHETGAVGPDATAFGWVRRSLGRKVERVTSSAGPCILRGWRPATCWWLGAVSVA